MKYHCSKALMHARRALPLIAILALPALPAVGSAQNVSFSVLPTYEEIRWDDAFGLEDTRLPGIRVGLDFGPFFSVQPFYSRQKGVEIREGLVPTVGEEVADAFDVELYGAEFQVNLGHWALAPFAKAGGGVLRTEDDVRGRRDRILLRGGGGVSFALGSRARVEVYGERLTVRLPSPFIPGAVTAEAFPDDGLVNSLVLGAGLRLPFGGGPQAGEGGFGILPGIFLEPYATRIDFADELRLERQYTAGLRAGVDLNQNVGVRAFYWRGVDDDFKEWDEVEGYGGELQFALNSGQGVSPFLLVGGGRIKFKGEYLDLDGLARSPEDHLTLGGGVAIAMGEHTRIELGVRNLLMTVGEDLEDVTSPGDFVSNWQYSAGISLALGASPRRPTAAAASDPNRARMERENAALREENERLRRGEDPARVQTIVRDTVTSPRTITVPVPEVGEIILRYGAEYAPAAGAADSVRAGVQAPQIEAIVREAVRAELARAGIQPGAAAPGQPAPVVVAVTPVPTGTFIAGRRLNALMPFVGVQVNPGEVLMGLRADLGPISDALPISLIPDVTFGLLGEDTASLMVGLNGRFGWNLGYGRNFHPFVEAGVAVSSRKFVTANLSYGAEFDVTLGSTVRRIFIQHRGVNAFQENQLLVGMRLAR